jgi:CDGSH-type Zn-finger protein
MTSDRKWLSAGEVARNVGQTAGLEADLVGLEDAQQHLCRCTPFGMAMCIMAYMRDSLRASIHPVRAGLLAFSCQIVTTSAHTRADHTKLRVRKQMQMPSVHVLYGSSLCRCGYLHRC